MILCGSFCLMLLTSACDTDYNLSWAYLNMLEDRVLEISQETFLRCSVLDPGIKRGIHIDVNTDSFITMFRNYYYYYFRTYI